MTYKKGQDMSSDMEGKMQSVYDQPMPSLDEIIAGCKEFGGGFNPYWTQRAIEEIEKLRRCLESRDNFLVSRDMFSDYVKTLG